MRRSTCCGALALCVVASIAAFHAVVASGTVVASVAPAAHVFSVESEHVTTDEESSTDVTASTVDPTSDEQEGTVEASTSTTPPTTAPAESELSDRDEPTDAETLAAVVAVLGAILLGALVIWMVDRAHAVQKSLAKSALSRGIAVGAATAPAAASIGGPESGVADAIAIAGPDQLVVGESGDFSIDASLENPIWEVTGLDAYARRTPTPHTFELTPNQPCAGGEVTVKSGSKSGKRAFKVDPAPKPPAFVLQLATRSWGLIVVAIGVVFGAVALGLTGRLDGGNFVALVAPLAALLGVTSAGGGRNDQTGGN